MKMNSDEAANDEPTTYNVEGEENRWGEDDHLNDIKGDLLSDIDKDPRANNKSHSNGESSNKDRMERDPRDDIKGPGRPSYIYPTDITSIVSGLHPIFQNGGIPPNSKVPYPYSVPYMLCAPDLDSKSGPMSRPHHPDIPAMYPLPGQLGQIPHPLAPWSTPPLYPMCTASTMASLMGRYSHPFGPFASSAAAAVASNMPRFPLGPGPPHGPGMHPTMIPHPALVSNGPLGNMGNGQHPHHGKHDSEKQGGRHSKSEGGHSHSKRDRPYVKKPLNAFMLYMKEQRAKVVAECTLKESAAINQILGRKWHSLSRDEQQKYYEMARKERQLHLQLYPGWSARDNYGKRKKRKKEKSQGDCTAQNPKKCRAVFGLEQQQLWCAPCRRKKKCIRYQHDDDSDEEDMSPSHSPQYHQNFSNQPNPFDAVRSTSPHSMTSQSTSITNGNADAPTLPSSRLSGNQISPRLQANDIKQEMRTSPLGMDGPHPIGSNGKNFDQFGTRHPNRAPSSDNSFKSEGSPNSQGGESSGSHGNNSSHSNGSHGNHHRTSNGNLNNNNNDILDGSLSRIGEGDPSLTMNGEPALSSGENRRFRKTNSLDNRDVPGPSGLTRSHSSGGNMPPLNTSGNSNNSGNSPGSKPHHHRSSVGKSSNGPTTPHMPHPSALHFLPPHSGGSPLLSPSYNHPSPHGPFMPPYSPYLTQASMLAAAALGAPPSPLGGLIGLSQFKGINPSSIGGAGPSAGSSRGHSSQARPGTVVEGKS